MPTIAIDFSKPTYVSLYQHQGHCWRISSWYALHIVPALCY